MIDKIREKVEAGEIEYSRHAVDQSILRRITVKDVRDAFGSAEIIEDYAEDKYGPSCLVLGFTSTHRPLHIQCSHPSRQLIKIITVYEPDPELWFNFRERKN
jgi:hypothetical protein